MSAYDGLQVMFGCDKMDSENILVYETCWYWDYAIHCKDIKVMINEKA